MGWAKAATGASCHEAARGGAMGPPEPSGGHPVPRTVSERQTGAANRRDWDAYADEYQATHGVFLRDVGFVWSPEGYDEGSARVLGDVAGRDVLEVGCGA